MGKSGTRHVFARKIVGRRIGRHSDLGTMENSVHHRANKSADVMNVRAWATWPEIVVRDPRRMPNMRRDRNGRTGDRGSPTQRWTAVVRR